MAHASMSDIVRNAKPGGFTEITPGVYEAVVSNVTFKPTKDGDPMFNVEFTIDDDSDQEGRKAWRRVAITENNVGIALNDLLILGTTQDDVAEACEEDNDAAIAHVCGQMIDNRVKIFVRLQTKAKDPQYNGRAEVYKLETLDGEAPVASPAPAARTTGRSGGKARPF